MHETNRHVIILAGPNGAGKTTVAPALHYTNSDLAKNSGAA